MRALILVTTLFISAPAFADGDADFKKQVEIIGKQYADAFNNKNADGVIANYAPDGIFLAADGHTERGDGLRKDLEANFSAGWQVDISVLEAHRFGDAGVAIGKFTISVPAKNIKFGANWSSTYVIDGDKVLIKLMAASVPPRPSK